MLKCFLSIGIWIILLSSSTPVDSKEKITNEKHNLVDAMIERRRKNNKDMKTSMEEFWRELIETREIKYGKDDHFERNLDYCRNFSERAVLHKGDEWNLKNIVKYCYWCMDKLNKMTREVKNEEFNINNWISERR
jgi:hypothetical protein